LKKRRLVRRFFMPGRHAGLRQAGVGARLPAACMILTISHETVYRRDTTAPHSIPYLRSIPTHKAYGGRVGAAVQPFADTLLRRI
jgi:hypothetical protein